MNSNKAQWKDPVLETLITKWGGGTNVQRKNLHLSRAWSNWD